MMCIDEPGLDYKIAFEAGKVTLRRMDGMIVALTPEAAVQAANELLAAAAAASGHQAWRD